MTYNGRLSPLLALCPLPLAQRATEMSNGDIVGTDMSALPTTEVSNGGSPPFVDFSILSLQSPQIPSFTILPLNLCGRFSRFGYRPVRVERKQNHRFGLNLLDI